MAVKAFNEISLSDFAQVEDLVVPEVLCEEELAKGTLPEDDFYKIAFSKHACQRMEEEGRDCELELVMQLFRDKYEPLVDINNGEEFILMRDDKKLAVVCEMHMQAGLPKIITVITVIRKVIVDENYNEIEKRVFINGDKTVI